MSYRDRNPVLGASAPALDLQPSSNCVRLCSGFFGRRSIFLSCTPTPTPEQNYAFAHHRSLDPGGRAGLAVSQVKSGTACRRALLAALSKPTPDSRVPPRATVRQPRRVVHVMQECFTYTSPSMSTGRACSGHLGAVADDI